MDSRKFIFQETGIVAIGQVVCIAVMFGVFALLGKFEPGVLYGGLLGGCVATLNFLFMAICASLASDKAEKQDVKGGKALLSASYFVRYGVMIVILFAAAKSGIFHVVALVLPLVFVRPTVTVAEFFKKSGGSAS